MSSWGGPMPEAGDRELGRALMSALSNPPLAIPRWIREALEGRDLVLQPATNTVH